MARKALIVKSKKKQKYAVRAVNRCLECGRSRGVIKKALGNSVICRIHFREYVYKGMIPGFKKKSW